jgi:hypothetical protein
MKPKWDLHIETRQGKCHWALRDPRQAPLVTEIASQYMLMLTVARRGSPQLTDKAALLTFPNRNRFHAGEDSH